MRYATTLALACALAVFGCADGADQDEELGLDEETAEVGPEEEMAEQYAYSDWDADADRFLDRDEWADWGAEHDWAAWDTDGEEGLTGDEFADATTDLWDTDDDDRISEAEWNEGTERWFGDELDYGTWADWDDDGDSFLDANEVREGFETNNLYDSVDRNQDAVIDDEELGDWFFDVFDWNDDDRIDSAEWDWGEQRGYTG